MLCSRESAPALSRMLSVSSILYPINHNDATDQASIRTDIYSASKTEAEKALWAAVKEDKPRFQVATILPNANFQRTPSKQTLR